MRLKKARVTKYRSIRDSGWFDVEKDKTILVGPNEAGKTVLLQALQQLHPPKGSRGFDPLRDYPRSEYNDITTGKVKPDHITVVTGEFELDDDDKHAISEEFRKATYVVGRRLNNEHWHDLRVCPLRRCTAKLRKTSPGCVLTSMLVSQSQPKARRQRPRQARSLQLLLRDGLIVNNSRLRRARNSQPGFRRFFH